MFALLLLYLVLGVGIVAAGKVLGRRAFAVAALAPFVTVVWAIARSDQVITPANRPTPGLSGAK